MSDSQRPVQPDAQETMRAVLAARTRLRSGAAGGAHGGTIRPVYGERRPVMYHLFENELKLVSSLNTMSIAFFSLGNFCLSLIVAILVSYVFFRRTNVGSSHNCSAFRYICGERSWYNILHSWRFCLFV